MIRPGVQVVIEGNERMFPTQPMMIYEIDGIPAQQPTSDSDAADPARSAGGE